MATSDGVQVTMKPTPKQLEKELQKRRKDLENDQGTMKKVAVFLDNWVQKNFKSEGKSVGGWAPLAAGGRLIRGKGLDTTAKILQDTGRLRASFKPFAVRGNAGIGSELPYSKRHEEGEGNLPKRRMLPEKPEVIDDAKKIIEKDLKEKLK